MEELQAALLALNSPVCFCHNDLLGGNIMYNSETKKLCFIDYEYGAYNFRGKFLVSPKIISVGFDFGNHFAEWSVVYTDPEYPFFHVESERYPNAQQQLEFCTSYLRQKQAFQKDLPAVAPEDNLQDEYVFAVQLSRLIAEANQFSLASHMLWAFWSIIQASSSDINFGFLEFGIARIREYYKRKDDYLYKHVYDRVYTSPGSKTYAYKKKIHCS